MFSRKCYVIDEMIYEVDGGIPGLVLWPGLSLLLVAICYSHLKRVFEAKLSGFEKANAKLLAALRETTSENARLATEIAEHVDDIKKLKQVTEIATNNLTRQTPPASPESSILAASVLDQIENEGFENGKPSTTSDDADAHLKKAECASVEHLLDQDKRNQEDAVERFTRQPSFDNALMLLVNGCGSKELADNLWITLANNLHDKMVSDEEAKAQKALESNDKALLDQVSTNLGTPYVNRARRRRQVIELNGQLENEIASGDFGNLQKILQEAIEFNKANIEEDDEQIPIEIIERAQIELALNDGKLNYILNSAEREDLAKVSSAVSDEMWFWQAPGELDNKSAELVSKGLHVCEELLSQTELDAAVESQDVEQLRVAVQNARLRSLSNVDIAGLRVAELLVTQNASRTRLQSALEQEDLGVVDAAIGQAETLLALSIEERDDGEADPLESLVKMLQSEQSMLASLLSRAKQASHQRHVQRVLSEAAESGDVEVMRSALANYRHLEKAGWIIDTPQRRSLDRAFRRRIALLALSSPAPIRADLEEDLCATAARLEFAEQLGLEYSDATFDQIRKEHVLGLESLLETIAGPCCASIAKELHLQRIDDLAELTTGDLRQARVARLDTRRLLPKLIKVGRDAESFVESAVADLKRIYEIDTENLPSSSSLPGT